VKGFTKDGHTALRAHAWPGNLRELRNAIERAVILCQGDQIAASDLPAPRTALAADGAQENIVRPGAHVTLEQLETEHIQRIVTTARSLQEAAEILGIDQATLYRKRKKLGIGG
jgi:two-component system, NtrC family, response regulator AlgB